MRDKNFRRVRVRSNYIFQPVLIDRSYPKTWDLKSGDKVKVINLKGCPSANEMGHCYIEKDGTFLGMVCTNSLIPIKVWERMNKKK